MDEEDDTANSSVETMLINALSRVQQSSERVNDTCEDAIDRLRGSMGIRMPGVKRKVEENLRKMIDELTVILKFIDMRTSYQRTRSGSMRLTLPPRMKDPREE